MIRWIFAALLLFYFPLTVSAQEVKDEWVTPNPYNLDPNWWSYYLFQGEELNRRVQDTERELKRLLQLDAAKETDEIAALIKKIDVNLKAYTELTGQKAKGAVLEPFKESYTLQQFLELSNAARQLENRIRNDKKELDLQKSRLSNANKHLDSLLVSYLKMKNPDLKKMTAGLELMALRAALGVDEEEVRLNLERLQEGELELKHFREALSFASDHLMLESIDQGELEKAILAAEEAEKIGEEKALKAETEAMGSFGDSPIERSSRFLLMQKSIRASVQSAVLSLDLLFKRAEKNLLLLHQKIGSEEIARDIQSWNRQLSEIRISLREWKEKSEQELHRISLLNTEGSIDLERIKEARYKEVQETLIYLQDLDLKIFTTSLLVDELEKVYESQKPFWVSFWYEIHKLTSSCCSPIVNWMNATLFKIGGVPITLFSLVTFISIIALAYLASAMVGHILKKMAIAEKGGLTQSSLFILNRMIHYVILIVGLSIALTTLGLDLSSIALVLGALSVGVGFGLQTIVNNFFSSLILLFSRTIKIGDYVELENGDYGQVTDVNAQNTVIHTSDGIDIVVPNSEMISKKLVNWTLSDGYKKIHVPFGVAYGCDKELVSKAVTEAAYRVPCTVTNVHGVEPPKVWLVNFGESSLNFELVVWINVYSSGHRGSWKASYNWEIEESLREYKIEIPYNQIEVRMMNR